jgi:Holliday junction DNA helicase RuvA
MIARLKGTLFEASFTEAVLDVNGVGYRVLIPLSTFDTLPQPGESVELLTYTQVREDAITLFGFNSKNEKELFMLLITVNGVGAKLALSILSSMPAQAFCSAIASGEINMIKKINGIGKRTAERLILELKDKVAKISGETESKTNIPDAVANYAEDAVLALGQLGIKAEKAGKAVRLAASKMSEEECSSENLIRKALQIINS